MLVTGTVQELPCFLARLRQKKQSKAGPSMKLQTNSVDEQEREQREEERRQVSTKTLYGALFHQRRRSSRRDNDHLNNYTDWYGHWPFAATFIVILLCFVDAFLTTILLNNGAVELNIFMDWLIQRDIFTFAVVKMSVTGVALLVLVMHFNFRIYRFIAVRYLIYALVPVYVLLIAHEINLISQI
jgi:hypothetical protein